MDSRSGGPARREHPAPSLEAVWAELNQLLLEEPQLEDFLRRLAELAASLAPGTRCAISVLPEAADQLAERDVAATRPEPGGVPGQRTPPHEGVEGPTRGGRDPSREPVVEPAAGGVAIPLVAGGTEIGVLGLSAGPARPLSQAEIERLQTFARLAAPAVMLVLRQSAHLVVDEQLQEAVVTRAVIDQAMGVLMAARRISSREAFEELNHASQTTNRKVSEIAGEVIEALTGHPPEPPRPLAPPRRRHRPDPTAP